jgi:hypothetical protein
MHGILCESLRAVAVREKRAVDLAYVAGELHALPEGERGPWDAAKDYRRLMHCQSEWIGFKARCCASPALAVPIGCNHRLCPLCNAGRLEHYRGPAREMLERMVNPCFLTLTVPNVPTLTKATFAQIRGWWKEFRRSNAIVGTGGVYSIEVTFNRETKEWHPHLHILFDSPFKLSLSPSSFRLLKRRLEFSWLRVTSARAKTAWGRGEQDFQCWNDACSVSEKGSAWNLANRRVVDLRRVKQGDGAVYEVIKYISKSNRFLDLPEAVEPYLRAVRGVRVIQTFGSFYNFKFERETAPQSFLKCECGKADFEPLGFFGLSSVYQAESGCWYLKRQHQHRTQCRSGPQ